MTRAECTRWMQDPPPGESGAVIASLLRDEVDRPTGALEEAAWYRLESKLRERPRRGRWAVLLVGIPALATAGGSLYLGTRGSSEPLRRVESAPAGRARHVSTTAVTSAVPVLAEEPAAPTSVIAAPPRSAPAPVRRLAPTAARSATDDLDAAALDAIEREAQSAGRSGDVATAERGYARLASSSGLRAENALFELGRLRLHVEKDVGGALDAWAEYRRRFPSGQLSTEVDLSVLGALERAGRIAEAVREGESFLMRRPTSERGGEVHALVGSLLQQRGDCARALPHLEAGAGALLSDARADELAYRRALCLRALGGGETARAALREYLDGHPRGRYRDSVEQALRE